MALNGIQRKTYSVGISIGCEALGSVVDSVSTLIRLRLCVWVIAGFTDAMHFRFRPEGLEEFDSTVAVGTVL